MEKHRLQIGVMGSWRSHLPAASYQIAEEVGEEIAKRGLALFTGGSTGIMEHAMKGAKKAGGTTIGVVPASHYSKYAYLGKFIDIKISTGTDEAGRIPILINSVEGIIVVGGGAGSLTEVALAYHQGKPIVVIEGSGELANKLPKILDADGYLDSKKLVKIQFAKTAKEAVDKLIKEIEKGEGKEAHSFGPEHAKRA
jgi:hypothetical protein